MLSMSSQLKSSRKVAYLIRLVNGPSLFLLVQQIVRLYVHIQ